MICPNCNMQMVIMNNSRIIEFRDKKITIDTGYYQCHQCGLRIGTIDQAAATQNAILDAFGRNLIEA